MKQIISETAGFVRNTLYCDSSGHDWWHVYRVWKTAIKIAREENADMAVVELASLLHDIADWKDHAGDASIGPKVARDWLAKFPGIMEKEVDHICFIIENMSFKGNGVAPVGLSLEGQIVQDADRLDAIGAIGIARTFAFGGRKGRLIYDPDIRPAQHTTPEAYINSTGPTINHFHEKLLLIKDLMNTAYGKKMAGRRHAFMENFLAEFYQEWEGE